MPIIENTKYMHMKKTSITLALLFALADSSCANAAAPEFIRTASTPAFETDFTEAAEP